MNILYMVILYLLCSNMCSAASDTPLTTSPTTPYQVLNTCVFHLDPSDDDDSSDDNDVTTRMKKLSLSGTKSTDSPPPSPEPSLLSLDEPKTSDEKISLPSDSDIDTRLKATQIHALIETIKKGDSRKLQILFDQGARGAFYHTKLYKTLGHDNSPENSPWCTAAKCMLDAWIKYLDAIQEKGPLYQIKILRESYLAYKEIVRMLLDFPDLHGVDLTSVVYNIKGTIFHMAAMYGCQDLIRLINQSKSLDIKKAVNATNEHDKSALAIAVQLHADLYDFSAWHQLIYQSHYQSTILELLEAGATYEAIKIWAPYYMLDIFEAWESA